MLVRDSLELLTRSLRPEDTVAVVGFDDQVELVLPPTHVQDRETILASLERLTPRGSTNVEGGLSLGYGMGNYNDHLMEQLADQGDGFYRYVDTYEEAEQVYVDELTSLLAPVADDARTQVELDPEYVTSYRLIGYENRAMDDESFGDLSADAGELLELASRLEYLPEGLPPGVDKVDVFVNPGAGQPRRFG